MKKVEQMGDRIYLSVTCKCGYNESDVYYAPTCGFMFWNCPKCDKVIDLEKYSGIDAESMATTTEGVKAIRDLHNNQQSRGKK